MADDGLESALPVGPPAPPMELSTARADPVLPEGFGLTDLMLLGMAFIWGVNFTVVKYGTAVVAPLAFNGARMLLASVALWVVVALTRPARMARRDVVALLALGVLGNGVYQYLFVQGIALTRAGNAALMLAATPAFVALFGRMRGVERTGLRALGGIILSVVGIGVIVLSTAQGESDGTASVAGDLLVLGGCLSWALYTVLLKPYTHRVDGVQLSAMTMASGTVALLIVAAPALVAAPWASLPAAGWGAVIYSGLGALVIAYLFWYRGVRVLGPTRAAMYSNLQPVIAIFIAWLVLAEVPTILQGVGALLILGGLLLTRSSR